jgi:GNAT superfamily N-acetyltransferase
MTIGPIPLRIARMDDAEGIDALIKASIRDIFPQFYSAEQSEASVRYIGSVDRQLIEDGTYFVADAGGEVVACGGWSRRAKVYTGSGPGTNDDRLLDPATEAGHVRAMFVRADWTRRGLGRRILEVSEAAARAEGFSALSVLGTLPGVPLYEANGFTETQRTDFEMPNGVRIECAEMEKPIGRRHHDGGPG